MPAAFSDTKTILAARQEVWAALTDWSQAPHWMPGVSAMRGSDELTVGSTLTFTARGKQRSSTITALDPGRLLTMSSTAPGVLADYTYELRDASDGTLVSLVADVDARGPMRLLGRVIRTAIAKEDGSQLTRLKTLVESRPA